MPGRIIQALRRAGVNNPVLMLDEVDKLGRDFRGDPASALLEILDPAQNRTFRDNYLDLPFDLSKVFFITTANALDTIPRPLLDRMEVMRLSGYSEEEKVQIAKRYLVPRQLKRGRPDAGAVADSRRDAAQDHRRYTREAGVRELERTLGRVAAEGGAAVRRGPDRPGDGRPEDLADLLGPERVRPEQARKELPPGVATGLAWTEAGGDVLYVEATLLPRRPRPDADGAARRGDEGVGPGGRSATSGRTPRDLGIDPAVFRGNGVHIHVPAGAVPKDGPSAGVAMVTALASLYTGVAGPQRHGHDGRDHAERAWCCRSAASRRRCWRPAGPASAASSCRKDNETRPARPARGGPQEMEFILAERIEDVLTAALPELAQRFRRSVGSA